MKTLVSSANRIENNLSDTFVRSLMQIKKNSGPKTDPCGTPQVTVLEVDLEFTDTISSAKLIQLTFLIGIMYTYYSANTVCCMVLYCR